MIVIDDILTSKVEFEDTYVAIGNFDGVHCGHKKLIRETVKKAKKDNKKSVVFTFANHPMEILHRDKKFSHINTNEEKLYLLEALGVDCVVLQSLENGFLEYSPLEFVEILKNKLKVKEIFVGFNFSFGKGGVGKVGDLKKLANSHGIEVIEVEPVMVDNQIVSSSLIRKKIVESDFKGAVKFLGHPMLVIGEVVHGRKIARELGFPTANINMSNRLFPPFGIYGAYLQIGDKNSELMYGAVNIGCNPTLKAGEISLEVHILDFDEDIYGKKIYIQIVEFMREERKFNSVEELKETIANDVNKWRKHKREMKYGSSIEIR
ncbi:MAG: bifunctional riboflavin kinase/FAD synthetase [Fusobacterium sp.]|uniref:bifunctional riboflavin kinase/FAD synthetase n=1 Tax=Fusobacterium sp. TaxID=68766 RepID=UPI0026DD877F|nr:bifunctional riboflavin kinase/FAD synthetase [Fusobacterium sp.]MDO4690739.1 bifunctional riboflavin kinase/FAD synthetase [Fusobacterium sp.]